MSPGTAVVMGASSPIARACALELASRGWKLVLGGRDMDELERIAGDIAIRTKALVEVLEFDALDIGAHSRMWHALEARTPDLCGVILAFGFMGDQAAMNETPEQAQTVLISNYNAAVSISLHAAKTLEAAKKGFICGISSVAGDRGRPSNYVYGSSKAGFAVFLEGLRGRLFHSGVTVLTVKPGFVDTSMTYGKKGVFLAAKPGDVGRTIVKAIEKGKDVIYVPGFWKVIMGIIKSIPRPVFKKLKL